MSKVAVISARVSPDERERLRELLMRGGLTVQDFLSGCVRVALAADKDLDPLGAAALLRHRSPASYREMARHRLGV